MLEIGKYFAAGVRLVWVIYPEQRQIYIYESPDSVRVISEAAELEGGPVLPGFRLPLVTLFEGLPEPAPDEQ